MAKSSSESRLMSFLAILVESAALQMFWLTFIAITISPALDAEFIALNTLPVIIGISNLLIHARVGLGWSQGSTEPHDSFFSPQPHLRSSRESIMPFSQLTSDASLEIIALLPLSAIASLKLVQKAWNDFVQANESNIYHNAAALHRFIPSPSISLEDSVASLDFDTAALGIRGWKEFCQVRLAVERNWNGLGPSAMRKLGALGHQIYYLKPIPHSEYTIVASYQSGIAVLDAHETIWALPPNYLQEPTFFAYDQRYLAFLRPVESTIEIWHDTSPTGASKPSPGQTIAADASAELYGPPDVGHFIPCYTLPALGVYTMRERPIKLVYPILIVNTHTEIHMWDISTGTLLRTLRTEGEFDNHDMRDMLGVELSEDFVLAFDEEQVRLFSRHDGNFLFHFSKSTTFLPSEPAAVQLLPPRHGATSGQFDGTPLQQQSLFRKRLPWTRSRGTFDEVGLSPCGTTLVAVTGNNRIFIVHDLHRLMTGDLPALNMVVEVKIGEEYGTPSRNYPSVTRDRIAVSTTLGIIVFAIDRSKGGSGPVPLCEGCTPSFPVQISACFIGLRGRSGDRNLDISGTKLFFIAQPGASLDDGLKRRPRSRDPRNTQTTAVSGPQPQPPVQPNQEEEEDPFDDMPELLSVSTAETDEESDDDDDPPSDTNGIRSTSVQGHDCGAQFTDPPLDGTSGVNAWLDAQYYSGFEPEDSTSDSDYDSEDSAFAAPDQAPPVCSVFVIDTAPGSECDYEL
ncbi:hypothetical protein FB451DRAFT_1362960 [Mycena latifolia]|nr:hypothetical protein FB451DRAFT_1362960 [Mycena latifolia]